MQTDAPMHADAQTEPTAVMQMEAQTDAPMHVDAQTESIKRVEFSTQMLIVTKLSKHYHDEYANNQDNQHPKSYAYDHYLSEIKDTAKDNEFSFGFGSRGHSNSVSKYPLTVHSI